MKLSERYNLHYDKHVMCRAVAIAIGSISLLLSSAPLFANPIPDAGSILRDQQNQMQNLPQLPFSAPVKEAPPSDESTLRVNVNAFVFSGYEGLATEAELQAVVAGAVGKKLSFAELSGEAEKVTAYLKQKGWFLARAYLPKQDVTMGTIEIAVTPGKSDGNLTINRDKQVRISDKKLRGFVKSALEAGKPINERALERSVLLISDLPGISARASLSPGTMTGTSGVELAVAEGPVFSGSIWTDNQGNLYTGEWRANSMFSFDDPFCCGDQVTLLLTEGERLRQGRVGYLFPIGYDGLKGNLAYTAMNYELGSDLLILQYGGKSSSIDAGLSYPIHRSRAGNIITSISYSNKSLIDSQYDIELHHKRVNSVLFTTSADHYDTILGGGYSSLNVAVTAGTVHEANQLAAAAATNRGEGRYARLNVTVMRQQRLTEKINLNVSVSGQRADDLLDSSEKFSLGGPNGVRAYPISEASGDEGELLNAEIRYSPPVPKGWGSLQFSGFYDAGHIRLQKHEVEIPATATNLNSYWLRGAGFGITYAIDGRLTLRGSWAWVIGDNPGRSVAGNNSDGRSDKSRMWLMALFSF